MPATPTMLMQPAGARHLLLVHRPVPIDNAEWQEFLDVAESIARAKGGVEVLVRTEEKGGPDAGQRADLNDRFANLKMRVAVLTSSRITRGIAMALSWLKVIDIKALPPNDVDSALDFLETSDDERAEIIAALRRLEQRIQLSTVA
jgi:hypothetical protein